MIRSSEEKRRRRERERLAYYEAGQAVMAFEHKCRIARVTILRDLYFQEHVGCALASGWMESMTDFAKRSKALIERRLLVFVAGLAAESHFSGVNNSGLAAGDSCVAFELAFRLHGDEVVAE